VWPGGNVTVTLCQPNASPFEVLLQGYMGRDYVYSIDNIYSLVKPNASITPFLHSITFTLQYIFANK
jgi:hypothetical protein